MDPDNKDPALASLEREWVQDALKLQLPRWGKRLAIGLTIISFFFYAGLYYLISEYRLQVAENIRELPIFTRIVLNIYQPFLVVFIIISLSLLVLLYLKLKRPHGRYRALLVLIVFNSLFAATLFGINFLRIN